jgi:uncharacterized protein YfaS (alpha-2-macroglobulin family)
MVLASLPRKISPSEKVTIPVTVFAMEKGISNVNVQIKTSGGLKVIGSASQNVTFTQPDENSLISIWPLADLPASEKCRLLQLRAGINHRMMSRLT